MEIPKASKVLSDKRNYINVKSMRNLWPQLKSRKNFDILYASWMILSAISLHSKGYRKFEQIQEQIERLFKIEKEVKIK